MIFVADLIPPELQRIIEFLNVQMSAAEVLGVAIQQYTGQGQRIFVPRVVGQTAAAQQRKSNASAETRQWDESSFFQVLEAKRNAQEAATARKIWEWARNRNLHISWGRGKYSGSFYPVLDWQGKRYWPVSVWTTGSIEVRFGSLQKQALFEREALRRELQQKLNKIPGIIIPDARISLFPTFPVACLTEEKSLCDFLAVLDWIIETIQKSGV